ncbi:hypothetical protein [Amycolatopsis suaedae]|uniref:Uncharacterized protein n=1 Tax=Amycolatopsis suaedae TaxID=2510978 RepID=A0A4Q7JCT8_9PSEU|nr:hypothetical protein [Amycolatopsis suaedae]RZQ64383.1 hypothetical protein EWH70_10500 [Amycolatopsis suaedae]
MESTRGWPAATALLSCTVLSLVGLTWDVQWHEDVGPDTFFTLPHLFIYAGSALAGVISLAVVLAMTAAQRAGRPVDATVGGRAIGVFGRTFAAPLGYLVSGTGAALVLAYGLWDQWWHGLYGFDAVIDSPPHIGLLLSIMITMVGAVIVFAAARHSRWGKVGMFAAVGVLLAFSTITVLGLSALDGTVDATTVGLAVLSTIVVLLSAAVRRGGALVTAVALALIQAFSWWFSPWAARVYADGVGLPVRDYVSDVPAMPSLMPMGLIVVALAVEVLLLGRNGRLVPVAGAVAGALVAFGQFAQRSWLYDVALPDPATTLATTGVAALAGALAGFAGWRFGEMLRLVAPEPVTAKEH